MRNEEETIRIVCRCLVCRGRAARLDQRKAEGLTDTMIHNYVSMAYSMHPTFATRVGVTREEESAR